MRSTIACLRERLPRATVITFWHIPFPNAERFGICPWREEIIAGLLGSSIVGFHTQQDVTNFLATCEVHLPQVTVDRERACVRVTIDRVQRDVYIRSYPISIDPVQLRAHMRDPRMIAAHATSRGSRRVGRAV